MKTSFVRREGRHVKDDCSENLNPEEKREAVRRECTLRHLDGYSDTKVIDPIEENFPSCAMPLSCTTPLTSTPAIVQNRAAEYLAHVWNLARVVRL